MLGDGLRSFFASSAASLARSGFSKPLRYFLPPAVPPAVPAAVPAAVRSDVQGAGQQTLLPELPSEALFSLRGSRGSISRLAVRPAVLCSYLHSQADIKVELRSLVHATRSR